MKFFKVLTIIVALFSVCCMTSVAKSNKAEQKAVAKQVKDLKAQGYTYVGSTAFSLEEVLTNFRSELRSHPDYIELVQEGRGSSLTAATLEALNSAAVTYATAAGSVVDGGLGRDVGNALSYHDKFTAMYKQKVQNFIMPCLQSRIVLKRVNPKSKLIETRISYIIDETKAIGARKQAAEEALREVNADAKFGEIVNEFVKNVVNPQE